MCLFRAPSFALCDCAHFTPVCLVSFAMVPKRRTEKAHPYGASNSMHSPPDQRAVGSPQALTPLAGFDVELPQSPARGAASRHSQEATQPAPSTPSRTQRETPPRLSQRTTQPMEWTPALTKGDGATCKTPPRHSQEITQPAPPPNLTKPGNWVRHPVPAHWYRYRRQ